MATTQKSAPAAKPQDAVPPPGEGTAKGKGSGPLPQRRQWIGRFLGPLLALLAYFAIPHDPDLPTGARTALAVAILVAVWWMTEAMPLAATSLVPLVALTFLGVVEIGDATSAYGHPIVFLFLGGFIIALAMQKWNLHKRIALLTMRMIGTSPQRLLLSVMVATWFISMWVSNSATAMMMLPIGVSVLAMLAASRTARGGEEGAGADGETDPVKTLYKDRETRNFAVSLMLGIAYAATIGGLGTLIGSPPNLIMAGLMEDNYDIVISFADWMKLGVPLSAVFLILAWLMLSKVIYRTRLTSVVGGRETIQAELDKLGPTSRGEWTVLAVFVTTALLWVFQDRLSDWDALTSVLPFFAHLDDTAIAIAAAVALFLIPVSVREGKQAMDWQTAQTGVPWGVLLLFGGGLCLAQSIEDTGLSDWIGVKLDGLGALPMVLLVVAVCAIVLMLTELTSNTATATTFLPVLAAVAVGIGIDPMLLMVPAALAATCSFMLPVGTPPNAVVFGSGYVTMPQMVRAGVWLNLIAVIVIPAGTLLLGGWAMGLSF